MTAVSRSHLLALPLLLTALSAVESRAGFVAHWRFEEEAAGTTASGSGSLLDSTTNNLHLNPRGNPQYSSVAGGGSTGMDFDGNGDLAWRSDSSAFRLTSLTIEAFVRYDGGSGLRQIVFRGDQRGGRDPFYLAVFNGSLRFNISDLSSDRILDAAPLLPVGELVHVAATLDHATDRMTIYVNGSEIASQSAAGVRPDVGLYSSGRVSVGGLSDGLGYGQYFDGIIDEVRIADTALNPSQFLYTAPVPEPTSLASFGLIASLALRRRRRSTVGNRD